MKKDFIFYSTAVLSVLMICSLGFAAYGKISEHTEKQKSDKTIIIDAGHGGEDGGAIGVDGIIEKDINLAISLKLKDLLQASGYEVIMTREKDKAIYDSGSKSLRQKKRSDLRNRLKIVKDNSENDNIFVSIHQNKFPDEKYFGTQIFYSTKDPLSEELASGIKDSIVNLIQPDNTRAIKPATEKIFLLNNAEIPAVVVECGFLSNDKEAKKLADSQYQSQMAFCIYCGILNYFLNNA